MHIYVYVCMYRSIYGYIYVHINLNVYIYVHICNQRLRSGHWMFWEDPGVYGSGHYCGGCFRTRRLCRACLGSYMLAFLLLLRPLYMVREIYLIAFMTVFIRVIRCVSTRYMFMPFMRGDIYVGTSSPLTPSLYGWIYVYIYTYIYIYIYICMCTFDLDTFHDTDKIHYYLSYNYHYNHYINVGTFSPITPSLYGECLPSLDSLTCCLLESVINLRSKG
jgi:hypothetical protein